MQEMLIVVARHRVLFFFTIIIIFCSVQSDTKDSLRLQCTVAPRDNEVSRYRKICSISLYRSLRYSEDPVITYNTVKS